MKQRLVRGDLLYAKCNRLNLKVAHPGMVYLWLEEKGG
mgnify:CR=1 FL=1